MTKPIACLIRDEAQPTPEILAALANQFDLRDLAADSVVPSDFESAELVLVFGDGVDSIYLQGLLQQSRAAQLPVVFFARDLPKDRRLQLLQQGVAEILDFSIDSAELEIRLMRVTDGAQQKRSIVELNGKLERLSAYFSDDVVRMILRQNSANHDYGENLEATVFFLDIRNFTRISEGVEPNLIAGLLNRLYTDIMDLILTYKGSVNKIIGDALLSTFGCPVHGDRDARNAVECALAIRDTLQLFNSTRPPYIQEDISIGMGIATGQVFAGTIGSYRKRDYTVIGDTVNIAARLEGLTKQTRFDLIIDRKTRDLAGPDLKVRKLQVSRVRGRTQPMEIFLVDGLAHDKPAVPADSIFFRT